MSKEQRKKLYAATRENIMTLGTYCHYFCRYRDTRKTEPNNFTPRRDYRFCNLFMEELETITGIQAVKRYALCLEVFGDHDIQRRPGTAHAIAYEIKGD